MFAKTELNLEVHIVEMVTEHNALNTASAYVETFVPMLKPGHQRQVYQICMQALFVLCFF